MARLTTLQLYDLARGAGFPRDTAVKMVAIALRESAGDPRAHNGVPPDDSYGLWQINMLGKLGPARLKLFGISTAADLFDPATNARAAYILWGGNDNNLNVAWAINKNGVVPWKDRYEANLPAAMAAMQQREGTGAGGPVLATNPPAAAGSGPFTQVSPLLPLAVTLIPLAASGKASAPCLAWLLPSSPGSSLSTPSAKEALAAIVAAYGQAAVSEAIRLANQATANAQKS